EGCAKELAEPCDDVVLEPVTIHDRDDVVGIRHERRGGNLSQVVRHSGTLVSENQARLVDAVPAEHTAHGVRDQVLHGSTLESQFGSRLVANILVPKVRVVEQRYSFGSGR